MRKKKQLLLDESFEIKKEFGGAHLKNSHAQTSRPIAIKKTMHLTLKSSMAKGAKSLRYDGNRIRKIDKVVRAQAKKFGVEIYRFANVGNHLHLLVRASYRKGFIAFLKAISGIIARIATGAERGKTASSERGKTTSSERGTEKLSDTQRKAQNGFWDQRPWTRILFTWTEFKNVKKYVEQNFNEAMGVVSYKPRSHQSRNYKRNTS